MRLRPFAPAARTGLVVLALSFSSAAAASAQVPPFRDVTGHDFGERITEHHQMERYLETLARASDRVRVVDQGRSWEGRRLLLAVVTAPENHARLDEIRAASRRLADPRTLSPGEAEELVRSQPVIAWYGGSIHGFELSGSEGALKLLEHLTTRNDEATLEVLRDVVVLIDPMLNPDGRDAFAHINHENIGREPTPERDDWSNDFTGWQGLKYRTGHYYFDTNRDWFAHTQAETRARVGTLHAWEPQVAVDLHEMGPDTEFYFDPAAEPYGPFFPEFALRWFTRFGEAHAEAFDGAGFEYMTRERYNYFYPGYTTSYNSFRGGVGMLYEQGSSRGLALERADGSVRTLADALEQQYTAAWAAARLAAREREALLRAFHQALRAAVEDGRQGVRRYVIAPEGDPNAVAELANLLMRNHIEVDVLTGPATLSGLRDRAGRPAGSRSFPAGSFVVEAAQPHNRLIRVLLEPDVPLPEAFLREARARVERDENPRFYDITAWSLPLLFDVQAFGSTDGRPLPVRRLTDEVRPRGPGRNTAVLAKAAPAEAASYAYLIDGRQAASMAAAYHLTARGHRAALLTRPTRIGEADVSGGTVIVRVGQNDASVHEAVRELADRYALDVRAVSTGHSPPGWPALGSGDATFHVKAPTIGLLAEDPVFGYSFGWAWYTLDRQFEIPVTVLRAGSLDRPLDRYDVLVLPELNGAALAARLGASGMERLQRWVRDGGTLVTLGGATDFAREQLGLISLRSWYDTEEAKDAQRFDVPGAVFRVELDTLAWLSAGYDAGELPALVESSRLYLPPEGPPDSRRRAAGRFAASGGSVLLSGHAWPETLERIPGAVFLYEERVGRGRVIAFAEDPNFRAFWRGANRLFLNAVVLGPSAP